MLVPHRGHAFEQRSAEEQINVRAQPFLGNLGIELQAIAIVWIDAIVAAQVGVTDAGHQQVTQARIIAKTIFLVLPLQRNHPLPATGQFAVPLGAEGQQFAQAVCAGNFFILIAAGKTQFVGQRRIQRHVVPQADVLPWRRHLCLPAVTVALGIDPMPGPVGFRARTDVSGETQAQPHGSWLAGFQLYRHWNHIIGSRGGHGIDPHTLEIAARLQRLIEFGNQFGVVGIAGLERHHALQQVFIERRVAGKADLAQGVARTTVVDQLDVGDTGLGVD